MFYRLKNKLTLLLSFFLVGGLFFGFTQPVHATLMNGSEAIDGLGQFDWEDVSNLSPIYTTGNFGGTPNRLGYSDPVGVTIDTTNHRLFFADSNNNRILVYNLNNDNSLPDRVPDYVLGQANFYSREDGSVAPTASSLSFPTGLAFDSTSSYLYVTDNVSSRVLVYDVSTISNGEAAVHVLGQPDFTTQDQTGASDSETFTPTGLALDSTGHRLFVSDTGYNRVLVYDVTTVVDGEAAVNVLGSPNFTTETGSRSQSRINQPGGLAYDATGSRLFVMDATNNRIMVFNVASITNGENAVNVLGQTTYTVGTSGTTQGKLKVSGTLFPGLFYEAGSSRLFAADANNIRVMVFDVASITDGENAVNVLGQTDYTTSTGATTQAKFLFPQGIAGDGTNIYVVDGSARRMTIFDVVSITDGENAVNVLGQSDGTSVSDPQPLYTRGNANDVVNRWGFSSPTGVAIDEVNHHLYVADGGWNRVLVYNLTENNALIDRLPDYVLGQPDFHSAGSSSASATTMAAPYGVVVDTSGQRLFVADSNYNRILVFDVSSITNGQAAVHVLGQSDFSSSGLATTRSGLRGPFGLAYDASGQRLFVDDNNNARVMVFDVASITDGEDAVNVLGKSDFVGTSCESSACIAGTREGLAYDQNRNLLFAATQSFGIRVFDVASITDGEDAVNVIGAPDLDSPASGLTDSTFNGVIRELAYDTINKRLFTVDGDPSIGSAGRRVLVFDLATITNGEAAVYVLGQPDFTSNDANLNASGMSAPYGLAYDSSNGVLYVSDGQYSRVTVYDAAVNGFVKSASTVTATEGGATGTFTVRLTGVPTTDVVVQVTSSDETIATVSPAILTFTSSNWNTPQTVTVTAAEDANYTRDTTTITLSIDDALSDNGFDSAADQAITVIANDNDQSPQTGGGGSSGPPPVTPSTPLTPVVISPPPAEANTEEPTEIPDNQLEDQPETCKVPKYTTSFIKLGGKNDTTEVMLLEQFLNLFFDTNLQVNGIYEQADKQAIIAFQEQYQTDILAPWKLKKGTGYVYTKTLAKIKQIVESRCQ